MSHKAMSMPLIVCVIEPPRPCQKVFWCSFSLTRSGSSAFSPRARGSRRASDARTRSSLVKTLPTPVTPSSVCTATSVWTQVSGLSSVVHPPSGVAPRRPTARISRIFMRPLLSRPLDGLPHLRDPLALDHLRAPGLTEDVSVVRRRQFHRRIVEPVEVVQPPDAPARLHRLPEPDQRLEVPLERREPVGIGMRGVDQPLFGRRIMPVRRRVSAQLPLADGRGEHALARH